MMKDKIENPLLSNLSTDHSDNNVSIYEKVELDHISKIRQHFSWIADPIYRASELVCKMPFYRWVEKLDSPTEFKCAATQLYFHSATFPKVLGLMLGNSSMKENMMMPFYAKHAVGEADHHELLMRWMLKHHVLADREEINNVIVTPETNACINLAYQLAIEQDRSKWLIAINCGIERCSNDFFKRVAPKMHALKAGNIYFDIHVEADEFHSILGLEHIEETEPGSHRRNILIAKGLEGISMWAAMLHSWIGINYHPKFNLDGTLV